MRLDAQEARARLAAADHAVLCTMHAARGVDAVPVAFALAERHHGGHDAGHGHLGVPVDLVKPKASTRLQRERNLEADPRATLLVDHWHRDDWTRLWWVRAELYWLQQPSAELVGALTDGLAERYPQYADRPFARVLAFRILALTGWAASIG